MPQGGKARHDDGNQASSSQSRPGNRAPHSSGESYPVPSSGSTLSATSPHTAPLTLDELIEKAKRIVHLLYNARDYNPERLRALFTAHAYLDFDGNVSTLYESQLSGHRWLERMIPKCTAELAHASATISRKTQNGQVVLTLQFPSLDQTVMRGGHISAKWRRDTDQKWRCCSFSMLFGPQGLPFGGRTEPLISKQGGNG